MTWSTSNVFDKWVSTTALATLTNATKPTGFTSVTADALKCALFNNTGTPNKSDTLANTAYAVGQWVVGNEVTDATNWVAGGRALATLAVATGAGSWALTAAATSGAGNVTMSNVYGDLVYDSSVSGGTGAANQGIAFHSYGGANSVVAGTFTVTWNASGVIQFTN